MSALARRLYRKIYKLRPIVGYVLLPYNALEYILLLLLHTRDLRRTEAVYPMRFGAFGHQASEPHLLAMRFKGKKLLILLSDYRNFNRYILESFHGVVDIRWLKHAWLGRFCYNRNFGTREIRAMQTWVLPRFLRCIGSNARIVPEFCERRDEQVTGSYINQHIDLLESDANIDVPVLSAPIERFRDLLHARFPEAQGRFCVGLYLRKKFASSYDIRDTDPTPYRAVIDHIFSKGGFVLCGGDYDPHVLYPGCPGIYGYNDFSCGRALCDYYFLTQPAFVIGGHSGPTPVAAVFRTPYLVTNNAFFYLSGYHATDMVLWKKLQERSTGRILQAQETFTFPIVALIENEPFVQRGLVHIDNTAEELVAAVDEMIARHVEGKAFNVHGEYKVLLDRFRALLPANAVAVRSPCTPCLSYLKNLLW
jgi:putative glycosyltransferase (TIGR04372 family)